MTYDIIRKDPVINTYIAHADATLEVLGYTEHSYAHVTKVAHTAGQLLETLKYPQRTVELAKIAGYMHDIGNVVNRSDHSQSGAVMAFRLLDKMGFDADEIAVIVSAIGNHDEGTGVPVSAVAAALILADKSDVRRSRVRSKQTETFDIHDRVNYSVTESSLRINAEQTQVLLALTVDTEFSPVMDYFEIFMGRMSLCRQAAKALGLEFKLMINQQTML